MENTDGIHHLRSSSLGLRVAADTERKAVSDFDAALHRIEKLLRLNEWRLALLLEGLEELSADMDKAAREVGR